MAEMTESMKSLKQGCAHRGEEIEGEQCDLIRAGAESEG